MCDVVSLCAERESVQVVVGRVCVVVTHTCRFRWSRFVLLFCDGWQGCRGRSFFLWGADCMWSTKCNKRIKTPRVARVILRPRATTYPSLTACKHHKSRVRVSTVCRINCVVVLAAAVAKSGGTQHTGRTHILPFTATTSGAKTS